MWQQFHPESSNVASSIEMLPNRGLEVNAKAERGRVRQRDEALIPWPVEVTRSAGRPASRVIITLHAASLERSKEAKQRRRPLVLRVTLKELLRQMLQVARQDWQQMASAAAAGLNPRP